MSGKGPGFIDEVEIFVEAGCGGKGCKSFHRLKNRKKKFPNGGDGGRGGHIIIKTDPNVYTLLEFKYKKHIKAEAGSCGGSNKKKGRDGKDYYIKVPPGTLIYNADNNLLLRDLTRPYQEVIIAKGGCGGLGNAKVKDLVPPEEGEKLHLYLELKLIAEVGLVGYPNAGKSSLISCISKAKPKIAAYPFTTKNPLLGIVEYKDTTFKVADIPGLIKGAHKGYGLGDRFLRHIERTKILTFIIDMAGVDGRLPWEDYYSLKNELRLYKESLTNKPFLVVANKMDLKEAKENLKRFKEITKEKVIEVSCKEKTGLDKLVREISKRI